MSFFTVKMSKFLGGAFAKIFDDVPTRQAYQMDSPVTGETKQLMIDETPMGEDDFVDFARKNARQGQAIKEDKEAKEPEGDRHKRYKMTEEEKEGQEKKKNDKNSSNSNPKGKDEDGDSDVEGYEEEIQDNDHSKETDGYRVQIFTCHGDKTLRAQKSSEYFCTRTEGMNDLVDYLTINFRERIMEVLRKGDAKELNLRVIRKKI